MSGRSWATTGDRIHLRSFRFQPQKLREKPDKIYFLIYVFHTILFRRQKICSKMFVVCRSATQPGIGQDLTSPLASTLSAQREIQSIHPPPPHTQGPQFSMRLLTSNSTGNRKEVRRKMRRGVQAEPHLGAAHSASPSHCRSGKNLLPTRLSKAGASPQAPHWALLLLRSPQALSETRSEFSGPLLFHHSSCPAGPQGGPCTQSRIPMDLLLPWPHLPLLI